MRKYFLLSAVVMLVATNANAEGDLGVMDFDISAEIDYAVDMECSAMDFGKLILRNDELDSSITMHIIPEMGDMTVTNIENIVDYSGQVAAYCSYPDDFTPDFTEMQVSLTNPDRPDLDNVPWVSEFQAGLGRIGGTLTIPAGTPAGKYTGVYYMQYTM